MQDPYRVLGIEPSASEDEIKKAYRSMAKKYHPDVNQGSPAAEAKMKEVNEAYSTIMKMRREGTSWTGSTGSAGGYGGYSGGYGRSYGGYGYGQGGYGFGQSGYGAAGTNDPKLNVARNYISQGRFDEAFSVLEAMRERTAEWYYLSGQASLGLGNRIAALNYARQAVSLDPGNYEYRVLLSQLEGSADFYQTGGASRGYGMPTALCRNPLLSCCLSQMLCSLLCSCCGGRPYWGGWYC